MKQNDNTIKYILSYLPNVVVTIIAFLFTISGIANELEILAEDSLYQNPSAIPSDVKIIAIDEKTLEELGPYTDWNRSYFADLIEILDSDADSKPLVIGLDIIFSGSDNSEGESRLADAAEKAGNVVLASKLEADSRVVLSDESGRYELISYIKDEVKAFEALSSVCESGFTNIILDDDGYVRRAYTRIDSAEVTYKSFSYLIAEKAASNSAVLNDLPLIPEIRYTGKPGEFTTVSMSSVLDGEIPAKYFADSIVLIGAHEEGMLDSYKVPIDHSTEMYGVECHANALYAFLNNKLIYSLPLFIEAIITAVITALYSLLMRKKRLRYSIISMVVILVAYPLCAFTVFVVTSVRLSLLYIPISIILAFFVFLVLRYVEVQKQRAGDMQKMLFSMADSMAEAIEGRTPYNANHTKNVANRCMEMLDYINKMHKEKRTDLYFTEKDRKQLYLAAMLHDIGKMDVPLEVMDKPTKLGNLEAPLRSRLEIIKLKIRNDCLSGVLSDESADEQINQIERFLGQLDKYNCGRPLDAEDWTFIDKICSSVYISKEGEETPYLTKEEVDDLHIKAGTLSENERQIMQSHVVYTDKILKHMQFGKDFSDVRTIAANHHELLNSKGYPNGIGADNLDVMTRILTIMDIYDSLIADDRPYKKAKPNNIAFKILDEEAELGKIDKELLAIAKEIWFIDTEK